MYRYIEFTSTIRLGRETKHGHRLTVDCVKPDGGRIRTDANPVTSSVTGRLPASSAEQRIGLGDALGQCMFPPPVLDAFHETISHLETGIGVRIRLLCDDVIAHWPWELVRIEIPPLKTRRFLFRDARFSLMRTLISEQPVDSPRERPKLTILVADATGVLPDRKLVPDFPAGLAADLGGELLGLDRPTRKSIDETIERITDGQDSLDIFHFTGHGLAAHNGQAGALVVYQEGGDRGAHNYRADELAAQLARAGTSLAFINACYTAGQDTPDDGPSVAHVLADLVPVVLAMRGDIEDLAATGFADVFYDLLLRGSTVDEAVSRGRLAVEESLPYWGSMVLYSRASTGRFLEPVTPAPEPVPEPVPPAARPPLILDGIRRWAMVGGSRGYWQLLPGEPGPELRRVDSETDADISSLGLLSTSVALSSDARVAAQVHEGRLEVAWVDRIRPRLDRWPRSFELPFSGPQARLLAVAVDYGDQVTCLISTDQATYRIAASPASSPDVTEIFDAPTRCAAILAGTMFTVDADGQLRGRTVNLRRQGIAEISSLDVARSGGHALYAIVGRDSSGEPIVAQYGGPDLVDMLPGRAADEVAVVRPLSRRRAPDQVLVAVGGHIERLRAGAGT